MFLTVTFDPGANGTFPSGTQTQQNIPATNSPLVPTAVPTPQPAANYGFIGWSADGGLTILTDTQALTTPITDNTTYVAQYVPPITLTFDGQGGAPATQTVTSVQVTGTYANALSQVTNPILDGFIFRGWWTTPNGSTSGVQILPTTVVGATTNQTLYAWWIPNPTVTITFDANGGAPATQVVPSRVVGSGYAATLAAVTPPTQAGYAFQGWFTAPSGGVQITAADTIPSTDTTLYAQWTPLPIITITFVAQGGTPDGQQQTVQTGDTYASALSAIRPPTRMGYAFSGWFTAPTGGTQILPTTVVTATTDQTLYAQWVSVTVTVTFDGGGGTPATQVVSGLAPLSSYAPVLAAIQTPTQSGYLFNGWHDQPQGMGGSSVTSGSLIPPNDTTVYAWWTPAPTITLTFDAQGGTPDGQTATVTTGGTYAAALAAVTNPALAGFVLQGWFTTPSGVAGGVQVLDTTVVTTTTDQTLYARWIANPTVTVTFDANGGTPTPQVVPDNTSGTSYGPVLAAITTPTQIGYTFNGWFDAASGGNEITASNTIPATDTTLYAQWTQIPPISVFFDANGGTFDPGTIIPGAGTTLVSNTLAQYTPATVGGTFLQAMSATPDPTPPNDGNTYYFGGWWTTTDTSGVQVLPTDTVWNEPGDITLYVHWVQVATVTLWFDANGGTPAMQTRRGAVVGQEILASVFIEQPTQTGYTFLGWFTDAAGGTQIADTDPIPSDNTTYYAQWAPIPPITITFAAQGGTPDGQQQQVVPGNTYAAALSAIRQPTQVGYAFAGWFTEPSGGTQILPTTVVTATTDQTLYAQWVAVTVTVTFDGGGGAPATQVVPGLAPFSSYAPVFASISTPTQSGYLFNGWHDQPQGMGGSSVTPGSLIPPTNTTVYAWWTPAPTITVTFDAQGGAPTPQTASVTTGDTYSTAITAITEPTQAGFLFQGWFTQPSGVAGGVQVLYTTVVTATTDQTLYAHWIANPTITITFNGNGGTPAAQVVPGQVSGNTFASTLAAITTPTQAGYVFRGWYTAATGGTHITSSSIIPAGAIPRTVYAQWDPIPVITLTFDAQGGTPDGQTEALQTGSLYGDALSLIQAPTRLGYVFAGWFTTPDGDMSGVQILDDTIVTATTNQTLYAHWIAVTVTITFDAQGGTPAIQLVPGKIYGDTYTNALASVTDPTQAFDTFLGWFTAPTGGTEITAADTIPASDTTLYAQWAPIQINIIFDALGAAPAMQEEPATAGDTFAAPFAAAATPTMPGSTFVGWFTQVIGGTQVYPADIVTQTTDQTLYAQWQSSTFRGDIILTGMHYAYLIGTGADSIEPNSFITRAEVANVLLRMLSDETRASFWTLENPFSDVPNNGGAWFSNGVSAINNMGVMIGFPDGTFQPGLNMTRAEIATVLTRFLSPEVQYTGTADMFPDISGSWARDNINLAAQFGWVLGDLSGNFNPDANMTRAEFATLVNRVLERTSIDIDTTNMISWIDNADTNAWFYWAVQIASNSAPGVPARNWAALTLPNASAEDAIVG
ncbi:MAG: InlB B-repeat-containing protein [Oscillospiraceae bacterium]|nr:InlB B-repeat-containing protein [Oscillospiraceae bacterium]